MKISVVIPIYNVEKYLDECLKSVFNQTYSDFEVILIDDGSTDGCKDICMKYVNLYPDRTFYHYKENGGLTSAWKKGMEFARGEYTAFVDSDDFIADNYLSTFMDAMDEDYDFIADDLIRYTNGDCQVIHTSSLEPGKYTNNDTLRSRMLCNKGDVEKLIGNNRVAKLIKTELVQRYAGYCDERIAMGEDQQLTAQIICNARKFRILDEHQYYYRNNPTSIMNSYRKGLWEEVKLLMTHFDRLPSLETVPEKREQLDSLTMLFGNTGLKNVYKIRSRKEAKEILTDPFYVSARERADLSNMSRFDTGLVLLGKLRLVGLLFLYIDLFRLYCRLTHRIYI